MHIFSEVIPIAGTHYVYDSNAIGFNNYRLKRKNLEIKNTGNMHNKSIITFINYSFSYYNPM